MKKANLYILGTATLLLLSGCGSSSSDSNKISSKEPATVVKKKSRTVDITVLGLAQEWQKEPVQNSWIEANSYCKNLTLEGKNDWRLPSSKEFFALLDNNKSIDEQFPKTSSIKEFWTSDETAFDNSKAWKISAWSNSEAYKDKKSLLGVRCIRGDKFTKHTIFFEDDVLKDVVKSKEIHWQDDKTSSLVLLNFDDAKAYCEAKSQRLPTIFEYQSVIDKKSLKSPFQYIKDDDFTSYWSYTAQPTDDKQVLTMNFMTGGVSFNSKDALNHVRCVKQINHAPTVEVNQTITLAEDSEIKILLQGEDRDGDVLESIITQAPKHGTYIDNIYKPEANFYGTDTIKYKVSDKTLTSSEATITIKVTSVNDVPTAKSMHISTIEDTAKSFTLEVNDVEESPLSFVIDKDVSHGSLRESKGIFTYTPATDFVGEDVFIYRLFDGSDYSSAETVTITVSAINDAPTANNQTITVDEDDIVSVTLKGSDIDGDNVSFQVMSQPSNGQLTGTAPNLTYKPNSDFFGVDSFTFKTSDGHLDSSIATVNITVTSVNDAPVVNNLNISTSKDTAKNIIFLVQDKDSSIINYHIKSQPSHGTLSGTMPTVTYTPEADFVGEDSFVYYVDDGSLNSSDATVTISVDSTNSAPVAEAKTITTKEDTDVAITLSGSDAENSSLTYILTSQPTHGTIVQNANILTYTPNPNYAGKDSFSYKVNDGELDSVMAEVAITVTETNDKPIATNLNIMMDEDSTKDIVLKGEDIDNDTLTYTTTSPSHGILSGSGKNITYKPNTNFHGVDMFTYTVSDGKESSNTATVSITVNNTNDKPIANNQNITLEEDSNKTIILTGTDADMSTLSYSVVTQPSHGSLSVIDSNVTIYTPDANYYGKDSFTFRVYDGTEYSNEATVTIDINSINDTPKIEPISLITIQEDTPTTISLVATDGDNDTLSYITTTPANGTLSINGTTLTYTPNKDYHGSDSFNVFAKDSESNSSTITVNINISSVNDAPVVDAGEDIVAHQGESVTLTGSATDDGTIVSYKWFEESTLLSEDATFSKNDFSVGEHILMLQVRDNEAEVSTDEVKVTIQPNTIPSKANHITHKVIENLTDIKLLKTIDIDNDGDLDILLTYFQDTDSVLAWYENRGDISSFTKHIIATEATAIEQVEAKPIDSDNLTDILYSLSNTVEICTNKPDKTFSCELNNNVQITGITPSNELQADMDNDDNIDTIEKINKDIILYENNETDRVIFLPKTGDVNDGGFGRDYNFTRDSDMVTDTDTGLMWQDDSAVSSNLGYWSDVNMSCSQLTMGNFDDWRFPNRHELYYLAQKNNDVLNDIFQNIGSSDLIITKRSDYWTSSKKEIYINFLTSTSNRAIGKNFVRCVRGKELVFNYIRDDDKKIVLDKTHNLMWEDANKSNSRTGDWAGAKNGCSNLNYLGFSDWRLPNIHELDAIFDDEGLHKAFKHRQSSNQYLYSSTKYLRHSSEKAYVIKVKNGIDNQVSLTSSLNYRCVRDIK